MSGPTSVAHLSWSGEVGGIQRLVHDLALAQRSQGLGVRVAMGRLEGPFVERLRGDGIDVADLGLRSGLDVRPGVTSRAQSLLAGADVIHMHGFNLAYWRILAPLEGALVYSEHGHFALGRRLGVSGRAKQLALRAFLRRHVDVITAVSEHIADKMRSVYGLGAEQVHVVPNGISCPGAPAEAPKRGRNALTVAFVGRLVAFKRVDRLIGAAARLADPSSIRVVIAGSGPLEAELRELARSRGADRIVEFAGTVDDVQGLLAGVDVVVQPSVGEPFGLAILEACCQGALPVVFADGGGALEVLPPDGIAVRDEAELAAVLTRLAAQGEATSASARERRAAWVRRAFPILTSAEAYLDLYRTVPEARG